MEKITAKEAVFDRIEQTFELFKDNFVKLILPIFLYTFFTATIFMSVISILGVKYGNILIQNLTKEDVAEKFSLLQYDAQIIIGIIVFIILAILYVTFYIPFLLATYKSIKQGYNGEEIKVKENIIYGFKNFLKSFQTYWYIFAYVALIPAIILIIGGLFSIYGMQFKNDNFVQIGIYISGLSVILFIIFSFYRGLKSTFALYSAVDKEEYTKQNFENSLNFTDNNWWRILGNIILTSIIISMLIGVISKFINSINSSFDLTSLIFNAGKIKENPEEIYKVLSETLSTYSPLNNFFGNIANDLFNTIKIVFLMIFSYILYKRLEIEYSNIKTNLEKKIEL